jgi:hypothetical protein
MPDTPRGSRPDPMTREVDRLLANLSTLGAQPEREHPARPRSSTSAGASQPRIAVGVARTAAGLTRADHLALWARVLLGLALAAAMTQWPYPYACDLPLLGYLGAVAAVLLAGGWIAFASWNLRSGLAHVLSLVIVFWGIVLAAEQALPRVGYAAEQASWRCRAEPAAEHRLAAGQEAR